MKVQPEIVFGIIVAFVLLILWYIFIREPSIAEVRDIIGELPSSMPSTTTLTKTPVVVTPTKVAAVVATVAASPVAAVVAPVVVAPVVAPVVVAPVVAPVVVAPVVAPVVVAPLIKLEDIVIPKLKFELYSGLNYTGVKKKVYGGESVQFAHYDGSANLHWQYKSMKVIPGATFNISNRVSGKEYIGHGIGKYNVPDLFDFIKSWDGLYHKTYFGSSQWARPFMIYIYDIPDSTLKEYYGCMRTIMQTGIDATAAGLRCFDKHPNSDQIFTA
jgi:hypothetical protein